MAGESGASSSILVVDDEEDILDMIEAGLSAQGYELTLANSGARALEVFEQRQFDLVICDIKMPGLGGIATITQLRQRDPALPVIVMTGYLSPDNLEDCKRLGDVALIRKPFAFSELSDVVSSSLRQRARP